MPDSQDSTTRSWAIGRRRRTEHRQYSSNASPFRAPRRYWKSLAAPAACWARLAESYDVTGLDRSQPMIAIARKRLPYIPIFRQDITSFHLDRRFDAIVCAFDSINHLPAICRLEESFPVRCPTPQCRRSFCFRREYPRQAATPRRRSAVG